MKVLPRWPGWAAVTACVWFGLCSLTARAGDSLLRVPIPEGIAESDLLNAKPSVRESLHAAAKRQLDAGEESAVDRIVVFVDSNGLPVLPDLAAAQGGSKRLLGDPWANNLTFTYSSPTYPWSAPELELLTNALNEFYPLARQVYGPPAFNIAVNIRKDPTIGYVGLYYSGLNEMVVKTGATYNVDVICHEMIHAFHDDDIIGYNSYEEGMTRAAEVEVGNRAVTYHFGDNHSYGYDVYYEGMNRPPVGGAGGSFFMGHSALQLTRYELAGYAWAKPFLENTNFFRHFNTQYYARVISDPSVRTTEAKLLDILTNVQAVVEGRAFTNWYARQAILSTNPPTGIYMLYQRINQYTVDFFARNAVTGVETPQVGQPVTWRVYDHRGQLLSTGTNTTSALGFISFSPTAPAGYTGRITVVVSGPCPTGTVWDSVSRQYGSEDGVFGAVSQISTGRVTVYPTDGTTPAASCALTNGAFSIPALTSARGRFVVAVTGPEGAGSLMHFTKDASSYFLGLSDTNMVALRCRTAAPTGGAFKIGWSGLALCRYVVQTNGIGAGADTYSDLSGPILISGTGESATNYLHAGARPGRYYRIRLVP